MKSLQHDILQKKLANLKIVQAPGPCFLTGRSPTGARTVLHELHKVSHTGKLTTMSYSL